MAWRWPSASIRPRRGPCSRRIRRRPASPRRRRGAIRRKRRRRPRAGRPTTRDSRRADRPRRRRGRALLGERREERELGAVSPPPVEQGRIGEAEGVVAGDGDVLAERRDAGVRRKLRQVVEGRASSSSRSMSTQAPIRSAARSMTAAASSASRRPAPARDGATAERAPGRRQRAEDREAGQMPRDRTGQQRPMPLARDPVEDHPGDRNIRPVAGKAAQQRRDRGALAAGVDDQHDRPAGDLRQLGGRARLAIGAGAVEQPHNAFAQHDLGRGFEAGRRRAASVAGRIAQASRLRHGAPLRRARERSGR